MTAFTRNFLLIFLSISLNFCSNTITDFTEDPKEIEPPITIHRNFSVENDSSFAYSLNVNLDINVTDAVMMRFSDNETFNSDWTAYSENYSFLNINKNENLVVNAEFLLIDDSIITLSDSITYINKIFDKEPLFENFGNSFSTSSNGNKVTVSYMNSDSFSIFNFNSSTNNWKNIIYKESSISTNNDFGNSISLSNDGSVLAVGCPLNSTSGSVFIYNTSTTTPVLINEIKSPDLSNDDLFGYKVKLSGDGLYLLVSAPKYKANISDPNSGTLYLIRISDQGYIKIIPPVSETRYDRFGINLYADSTLSNIIVSSTSLNINTDETVFYYTSNLSTSTFVKLFKKTDTSTTNIYSFGSSFAIDSTNTLIAICEADHNQKGAVHIYQKSAGLFPDSANTTITINDIPNSSKFGNSIAFSTDSKLYIGSYGLNSLYEYKIDNLNFTLNKTIIPADISTGDNFASSIMLSGDNTKILASSPENNNGAVYNIER